VLTDSYIERDAVIERAIIDKGVVVSQGARVGQHLDDQLGIACIGKNSTVPPNFTVEHSVLLGTDLLADDVSDQYPNRIVPAGARVGFKQPK